MAQHSMLDICQNPSRNIESSGVCCCTLTGAMDATAILVFSPFTYYNACLCPDF